MIAYCTISYPQCKYVCLFVILYSSLNRYQLTTRKLVFKPWYNNTDTEYICTWDWPSWASVRFCFDTVAYLRKICLLSAIACKPIEKEVFSRAPLSTTIHSMPQFWRAVKILLQLLLIILVEIKYNLTE